MSYIQQPGGSGGSGGITSINGDTTAAQLIVGGTDISASTVAGTTTISFTGSAGGVTSLNSLTGALTIAQTTTGTDFTVSTSGGNTVNLNLPVASASNTGKLSSTDWSTFNNKQATVSFGTFGSTPNSAGGGISAGVITLQPANATNPGGVSTTTQTFAGNKTFNGTVSLAAGTVGSPELYLSTDSTTGWYRTAANEWAWAHTGRRQLVMGNSAMYWYDPNSSSVVSLQVDGVTAYFLYGSGVSTYQIESSINGYQILEFNNTQTNGNNWGWYNLAGASAGNNAGAMFLRNGISPSNFIFGVSPTETVFVSDDDITVGLYTNFTVVKPTDKTGVGGTTTANASTTISHGSGTGVSTSFLRNFGLGDRLSLSSASSTYATVTAIASDSSLTVNTALGNGTSQTINRKRAIQRWDSAAATPVMILNDQGRLGINILAPASLLHVDGGTATASELRFTAGTTTGQTSSDGFQVGVTTTGKAELRQRENLALEFYTNNTSQAIIQPSGRLTVGDTSETISFFLTPATKLLANGTMTTVASSFADLIQLGATTVFQLSPSADTNSGLGVSLYGVQGFNVNVVSSFNVNGGLSVLGIPWVTSVLGAFGQVNINDCTGKTVDGILGLGCTASHNGYGGTLTNGVGGAFVFSSNDDGASGSPTGTISGTCIGGNFLVYIDQNGLSIPTAGSGRFIEPYVVGGSGTITNKTAAWIDGTFSITETDASTTGNIDAFAPVTSYNYNTGAAPVLRGINNDTFNKVLIFDFLNTATIANESGGVGTAAKRITTGTGADLALVKSCILVYNTTTSRWRVVSYRL